MDMNYRGGMWEGGGGQDGVELGGEWDNCNSIINKYILKKERNSLNQFKLDNIYSSPQRQSEINEMGMLKKQGMVRITIGIYSHK